MALILALETTSTVCSIALFQNDTLLESRELNQPQSHSQKTTVFIEQVLEGSQKNVQKLDAVAVSRGPGSYTGLRIGASVAKGLCYARQIPLITVSTLKAMSWGWLHEEDHSTPEPNTLLVPMLDARRMEVYTAVYDTELNSRVAPHPKVIDEQSFHSYLEEHSLLLFGNGAEKCREVLDSTHLQFYPEFLPSATYMGELAYQKYEQQLFEDIAYFEPSYLKAFQG